MPYLASMSAYLLSTKVRKFQESSKKVPSTHSYGQRRWRRCGARPCRAHRCNRDVRSGRLQGCRGHRLDGVRCSQLRHAAAPLPQPSCLRARAAGGSRRKGAAETPSLGTVHAAHRAVRVEGGCCDAAARRGGRLGSRCCHYAGRLLCSVPSPLNTHYSAPRGSIGSRLLSDEGVHVLSACACS